MLLSYAHGRADVDAALGRLRQETRGTPMAQPVAAVGSAAGDWQRWAEAMRTRVGTSRGSVRDAAAD